MIYEEMDREALNIISDVRNRYDGYKRNPFNEEECGNHYARAMATWSALIAYSRFHYSAVEKEFTITSKPGNYFWSDGYSWGNAIVGDHTVLISVHYGKLEIKTIRLEGKGELTLKKIQTIGENSAQEYVIL